jgi:hypothetical protein
MSIMMTQFTAIALIEMGTILGMTKLSIISLIYILEILVSCSQAS